MQLLFFIFAIAFVYAIVLIITGLFEMKKMQQSLDIRQVEAKQQEAMLAMQLPQHKMNPLQLNIDLWHEQLTVYLPFYNMLDESKQDLFREKMNQFLHKVQIIPIEIELEERDYLFIASSAILPVFHLKAWFYPNLRRVVMHQRYLGTFHDNEGNELHTAGFINFKLDAGTVHLTRQALWYDFLHDTPSNVALHEFMHLLDHHDQSMDGVPSILMDKVHQASWVALMTAEIAQIVNDESSLNDYAGENSAEFLATICEYYFKQPNRLKQEHPRLMHILDQTFKGE